MKVITDFSVSSRPLRVGAGFSPRCLFRGGMTGIWMDASSIQGIFGNLEGTPPNAQPGQQIARLNDASGNELHALQPSVALRPLLGRAPATGQRNILRETGFTSITSGTPGGGSIAGFSRIFAHGTQTVTQDDASLGGASLRVDVSDGRHVWSTNIPLPAETTITFSADVDVHSGSVKPIDILSFPAVSAVNIDARLNGASISVVAPLPTGRGVLEMTTTTATEGNLNTRFGVGLGTNATGDVTFRDIQFEIGAERSAYQRVEANGLDVIEAGVPSPAFIRFDHADDVLASTFPDGGTFDVMIFGRQGSWIERDVTIAPAGSLNIGPTTITGGPAGLLEAVGDVVGWLALGRTITDAERDNLLTHYAKRGAGNLLESI